MFLLLPGYSPLLGRLYHALAFFFLMALWLTMEVKAAETAFPASTSLPVSPSAAPATSAPPASSASSAAPATSTMPSDNRTSAKPHSDASGGNKTKDEDLGLWAVEDPSVKYDPHSHHHAPYCLLLQMKAALVIPTKAWKTTKGSQKSSDNEETYDEDEDLDLLDEDDGVVVKNRTIWIPSSAVATGTCTDTQQTITLSWNNTAESGKLVKTGHIVFIFVKGVHEGNTTKLASVYSTISLFLDPSGAHSVYDGGAKTQHLDMRIRDVALWQTPNRFAFVCRTRSTVRLEANTSPVEGGNYDSVLVDPIENDEAFLEVDFIRVQAFRSNGFAKHFTHLQYDCTRNWPYDYMPWAVGIALLVLVVVNIVAFLLRKKMGCTPAYEDLEEEGSSQDVPKTVIVKGGNAVITVTPPGGESSLRKGV